MINSAPGPAGGAAPSEGPISPEPPLRWLRRAEENLGTFLLCLIFLSVALQVVGRLVFRSPPFWTEELARYLFVWLVCIGSAEVVRIRGHITMDLLATMLGPRVKVLLQILLNAAILASLVVLVWYSWQGAIRAGRIDSVALGVPESLLYGALPVGAALMTLRILMLLAADISELHRGAMGRPKARGTK